MKNFRKENIPSCVNINTDKQRDRQIERQTDAPPKRNLVAEVITSSNGKKSTAKKKEANYQGNI